MLKSIKSGKLTVSVDTMGAEIKNVKNNDGVEFIWEADPDIWSGTAPILFPICGGVAGDEYTYNGKKYTIGKHGFARQMEFEVESISESTVTMLLKSNEKTLLMYPFAFEFRVTIAVVDNSVAVTYSVKNKNDNAMYFSVGAHEAYATPEGIEEYDVVFEKPETLDTYALDGNMLTYNKKNIITNSNTLKLDDSYFVTDALVFKEHLSNSCTLVHRNGTRRVKVEFSDFSYLLLWHKHLSKYLCIEPWNGLPDLSDSDGDFTHKFGIKQLDANCEYKADHKITFTI